MQPLDQIGWKSVRRGSYLLYFGGRIECLLLVTLCVLFRHVIKSSHYLVLILLISTNLKNYTELLTLKKKTNYDTIYYDEIIMTCIKRGA